MLMAEASRRLKVRARKLGSCIDKARPFYEALNMSKQAQQQCQIAAVKYQRANGKIIYSKLLYHILVEICSITLIY